MRKLLTLLIVAFAAMVLFGCITPPGPEPTPTPTPTPIITPSPVPTPTPTPTPVPFAPFGLVYTLRMPSGGGPDSPSEFQEMNATYWFEEKRQCDGGPAFVGVGKFSGEQYGGGDAYFKTTVYLDNGEFVQSNEMQRGELAFDTATSKAIDTFDAAFMPNGIFASVDRNFLTDGVWNSSDPVILRNASIFAGTPADIAVTKKGMNSSATVPCTIFSLSSRNSPTAFEICVARAEQGNLQYMVYFKPEDSAYANMMPTWRLTTKLNAASGLTRTLQCLAPVHCPYVQTPSGDARTQCEADGQHVMSEVKDENGCVVRYQCVAAERARLYVEVLNPGHQPVPNLEVDYWEGAAQPQSGPNMAANTNAQGVASFNVTQGNGWVGFNGNNFPSQYRDPGPAQIRVDQNESHYTVNLRPAGG